MKHKVLLAIPVIALGVLAVWLLRNTGATEERLNLLDPARVQLIRTPGGHLQVSEMRKTEEFAWQTSWQCPVVDCKALPKTVSKIRVNAHYVYRIPLAAEWRLEPAGDHYRLTVPQIAVQLPVAFDTKSIEIATTEQSFFSPAVAPNRENTLRNLGPELAHRGTRADYYETQRASAEKTVQEFATKWMLEQGKQPGKPIRVQFTGPNPS